ncbi:hypothetical protein CPB85DRAFT_1337931, partial [Mucidula mucida]
RPALRKLAQTAPHDLSAFRKFSDFVTKALYCDVPQTKLLPSSDLDTPVNAAACALAALRTCIKEIIKNEPSSCNSQTIDAHQIKFLVENHGHRVAKQVFDDRAILYLVRAHKLLSDNPTLVEESFRVGYSIVLTHLMVAGLAPYLAHHSVIASAVRARQKLHMWMRQCMEHNHALVRHIDFPTITVNPNLQPLEKFKNWDNYDHVAGIVRRKEGIECATVLPVDHVTSRRTKQTKLTYYTYSRLDGRLIYSTLSL